MERAILRENRESNHFDSQSPVKAQINNTSESEDISNIDPYDTTKENYNPKSLSEIASEKSVISSPRSFDGNTNSTSTPKVVGKKDLSSDYELDKTVNLTPHYPRNEGQRAKNDSNLSSLLAGINNLGINSSDQSVISRENRGNNLTFSDDEEQFVECESFNDNSNRFANNTVVHDEKNDSNINKTINIESENIAVVTLTNDESKENISPNDLSHSNSNEKDNEDEINPTTPQPQQFDDDVSMKEDSRYLPMKTNDRKSLEQATSQAIQETSEQSTSNVEATKPVESELNSDQTSTAIDEEAHSDVNEETVKHSKPEINVEQATPEVKNEEINLSKPSSEISNEEIKDSEPEVSLEETSPGTIEEEPKLPESEVHVKQTSPETNKEEVKLQESEVIEEQTSPIAGKEEVKFPESEANAKQTSPEINKEEAKLPASDSSVEQTSPETEKEEVKLSESQVSVEQTSPEINKEKSKLPESEVSVEQTSPEINKEETKLPESEVNVEKVSPEEIKFSVPLPSENDDKIIPNVDVQNTTPIGECRQQPPSETSFNSSQNSFEKLEKSIEIQVERENLLHQNVVQTPPDNETNTEKSFKKEESQQLTEDDSEIKQFPNMISPAIEGIFEKPKETIFVDKIENQVDVEFKMPTMPIFSSKQDDFKSSSSCNFGDSDFDFLQNFGTSVQARLSVLQRDSVLLKFDPLLNLPVVKTLEPTKEEDDYIADLELNIPKKIQYSPNSSAASYSSFNEQPTRQLLTEEDEMSLNVDIMKDKTTEHESFESNHIQCEESKLNSYNEDNSTIKMADLENKIKKEAEMREEALLKRISEKDKQIVKMNGVVEAYEKAISELIAEKDKLVQSYEKKCSDLKNDSELNANHLASLEATFSDLHAKYERTKQIATELKDREETILQDKKTLIDSLKMQEARYDKMKSHAMSQLEIANNSLADMSRTHQAEVTKLKALLKKEEISRASINEQLIQKAKENSELVKICDELINGSQPS
ncbi:CLUMA_CG014890, isoform A [Clunio marinus]|uniref:CLUMA_CG014890, isoform A n=1 Tax=Clunio marinus TaxID=568069 RepID=A0A1J1IRG6_9DIPT|nr:CLUMA_CG014890, isoform A [Clunio marinus]